MCDEVKYRLESGIGFPEAKSREEISNELLYGINGIIYCGGKVIGELISIAFRHHDLYLPWRYGDEPNIRARRATYICIKFKINENYNDIEMHVAESGVRELLSIEIDGIKYNLEEENQHNNYDGTANLYIYGIDKHMKIIIDKYRPYIKAKYSSLL